MYDKKVLVGTYIRLPYADKLKAQQICELKGLPFADLMRHLLEKFLEKHGGLGEPLIKRG